MFSKVAFAVPCDTHNTTKVFKRNVVLARFKPEDVSLLTSDLFDQFLLSFVDLFFDRLRPDSPVIGSVRLREVD